MLINNVKKGMRVQLCNGWYGTMMDNAKGNVRMVDVEGLFREIGSVYSHDIVRVLVTVENEAGISMHRWEQVELSPAQEKNVQKIKAAGF